MRDARERIRASEETRNMEDLTARMRASLRECLGRCAERVAQCEATWKDQSIYHRTQLLSKLIHSCCCVS